MGRVIQFPPEKARQGYDPNALRHLQLDPPPPPQVTVLGECALTGADLRLLVSLLQKNPQLWSIRLLDRGECELIAFTGDLPPCRVVRDAEKARAKKGVRVLEEAGSPVEGED